MVSSRLAPCPDTPNCVSTDATDRVHAAAPFRLAVPARQGWTAVRAAVGELPRARIVAERHDYLHAECRSLIFGFVDDLELELRSSAGMIAVRSAARVGRGDLGVNRRRVERLRAMLTVRGVIH